MTAALRQSMIVRLGQVRTPRVRLLCVPQAGGGTATFRSLTAVLPTTVDLCAVRLPGRETRRREPSLRSMDEVVAETLDALDGMEPLPLALLGYCSGSFPAYELARRLSAVGRPPVRLISLASPGPRVVTPDRWVHSLSDEGLIDYLRRTKVTPEPILSDPELFRMFEPGVRADFEAYEKWDPRAESPLDVPVTVIGAREDDSVDLSDLLMWREHTSREFTLRILPGGHDFLGAATGMVGRALIGDLLTKDQA